MATLAQWDMTSLEASTEAEGVTADLNNDQGLPRFTAGMVWGYDSDPVLTTVPKDVAVNSLTALTNASYFEVVLSPVEGATMSLSRISARVARGGTTNRGAYLRWETTNLWGATLTLLRPTWHPSPPDVDLSGRPELQNVATPVAFRFYVWGGPGRQIDWDQITIEGTVVLPAGGAAYRPWLITGGRMR